MPELFTLTCDKLQEVAFVGFRGKEQISRPYEFELFFTVPVGTAVKDAIGASASIEVQRSEDAEPMFIHGVIAAVSLVHQNTNKARTPEDRALYRALLVPRLWLLQHFWRSFVFVEKNVKEFLSETLEAGGLVSSDFKFDIDAGAYPKEEFVAQYRESHLDFFHRWLEREGLYYYFEHKKGGPEVLVVVEDKSHTEAFPGEGKVRYYPLVGDDVAAPAALHDLSADMQWLPKTVTIADYDYSNPTTPVKGDSPVTTNGIGTIRDYGFRVFAESEAKRLAKVKAQAIGCREQTLRASGTCLGPRAGYKLGIDERPDDLEEEWLAVEVEHVGVLRGLTEHTARLTRLPMNRTYSMKLFAIPASVQYRAPQSTPWPRIYGFENGLVMGEADSPYAQIDNDGRYLVRFEFDTSDNADGKVSTRIRMLQPHGGEKEGFHFPLRKGTEVMICFLGGDCDRPFIAGVVPNAHKPSVVGSRNHTQNIIRTGSNNQIVLEDEQGKEFIFMHTPNQKTGIYMGNPAGSHSSVYTGENSSVSVDGPARAAPAGKPTPPGAQQDINTTASFHMATEMNHVFFIGGSSTTYIGTGPENTYVGGDVVHGYTGTFGLMVGKASSEFFYATRETTTFGLRTDIAKAGFVHTVEAGNMTQTISDNLEQTIHGNYNCTTDGNFHGKFNNSSAQLFGGGGKLSLHANTAIFLDAPDIYLNATNIHLNATAKVQIDGKGQIKAATPSFFKDTLGIDNTGFVGKNSAGVEKMDLTGVKVDVAGFSRAAAGSKLELVGSSTGAGITKSDTYAIKDGKATSNTKMDALKVFTQGFFKL